ncbi:MAG: hypothetical protein HPY59_07840 [Anaerolineae bacterium]|nr:hypothetical protein [Anaerolineae bacterium]
MASILLDRLLVVKDRVSKLNKKADARGLPKIELITGKKFHALLTTIIDKEPCTVRADYIEVEITGSLLPIGEHNLVGWIDERDGYRIVWGDVPFELCDADMLHCDHCGTKRNRKTLAVIRDTKEQSIKVIGKSCFADFFGIENAETLISYGNFYTSVVNTLDDENDILSELGGSRIVDSMRFLGLACELVLKEGYFGAQNAQGIPSTGYEALAGAFKFHSPSDQGVKMAQKVAAHFLQLAEGKSRLNNYETNVITILKVGYVAERGSNTLASSVAAYLKTLGSNGQSNYVGTVGERTELEIMLLRVHSFEGSYGWTVMNIFQDENGNSIVWKTSKNINIDVLDKGQTARQDLVPGQRIRVRATIGEHKLYEKPGSAPLKTTYLKRLKVVSLIR